MKTVQMTSNYDYTPRDRRIMVRFLAGVIYRRVIDAAASAIERAGAGHILAGEDINAVGSVDAGHVWQRRPR